MFIAWFVHHVSLRIIQYSISWGSLVNDDEVLKMGIAFGRAVKLRRVELGYNQEGLADKSELARSFVSSVERGVAKASIASVWKLAQALNCNPSDLWITAERLYDAR
ncbi:helix-turn-helix transcriptional regulator [Shewanella sp. DC2-4]|nr:helix-turn-helix transcriptional regulator [Shewanella sp. DC2-4]